MCLYAQNSIWDIKFLAVVFGQSIKYSCMIFISVNVTKISQQRSLSTSSQSNNSTKKKYYQKFSIFSLLTMTSRKCFNKALNNSFPFIDYCPSFSLLAFSFWFWINCVKVFYRSLSNEASFIRAKPKRESFYC